MNKRPLIISGLGIAVVFTALLLLTRGPLETVYQGKTVREWAMLANAGDGEAQANLRHFPNAAPGLIRMLGAKDSWWGKQIWTHTYLIPKSVRSRVLRHVPPPSAAEIRVCGAHALACLGPQAIEAAQALARGLRDSNSRVRWESALALARIGPPSVALLKAALKDSAPVTRHAAAAGLEAIGPAAAPAMRDLTLLLRDPDEEVRMAAAHCIVTVGTPRSSVPPPATANLDPKYSADRIRFQRDWTLNGYVQPILSLLASDDWRTRQQAVQMLGFVRVASDEALQALTNCLADTNVQVRLAACKALGGMVQRPARCVPALMPLLVDPSLVVRQAAAEALGRLDSGPRVAIPE